MTIKYAPLFRLQENALTQYLFEEYGMLVSTRITDKILADIQDIPPFTSKYPLYMNYRGYEIHRIAQKRNYIFYTVSGETLWVLAIFSTRMSPATMRKLVIQQVTSLNH